MPEWRHWLGLTRQTLTQDDGDPHRAEEREDGTADQ